MIKFLQRRQINDQQWNSVISASAYETIYPYTWYLDACADHWGAYVINDYEYIMPLAYRKKLGLKYTYQPVYCQQLGIYSGSEIDVGTVRMFIHALGKDYKMGDYSLNEGNILGEEKGFELSDNSNYLLSLDRPYDDILKNYSENCRRNLKRSYQSDLEFTEKVSIEDVVMLKRSGEKNDRGDAHYEYVRKLFSQLDTLGKIRIYGARKEKELLAAAIFAFSTKRAIFLLSASSERGKDQRAMFLILDTFIQIHAGQVRWLDFEGSNISSIARFFRGFGARPAIYQRIRIRNSANRIIKKIKRA